MTETEHHIFMRKMVKQLKNAVFFEKVYILDGRLLCLFPAFRDSGPVRLCNVTACKKIFRKAAFS